ncbi:hypothetical protein ACNS7O_07525 [Haloferacaceae archaeon DSL9]
MMRTPERSRIVLLSGLAGLLFVFVAVVAFPEPADIAVVLFVAVVAGVMASRVTRLAAPAVGSVLAVGLTAFGHARLTLVFGLLPLVGLLTCVEYLLRRVDDRLSVRLAPETERALLIGSLAGLVWLAVVLAVLPPADGLGVAVESLSVPGERIDAGFELLYASAGPVVIVGVPIALAIGQRLFSPLLVTSVEVASLLLASGGDAIGSAASLLWPVGLAVVFGLALVESGLRELVRSRVDRTGTS